MKNSNFKTFRRVNGVASFCEVNSAECLIVINREKNISNFSYCTLILSLVAKMNLEEHPKVFPYLSSLLVFH